MPTNRLPRASLHICTAVILSEKHIGKEVPKGAYHKVMCVVQDLDITSLLVRGSDVTPHHSSGLSQS